MDDEESECLIVPVKQGNPPQGTRWREGGTGVMEPMEGKMPDTPRSETISTKQNRIAELARQMPNVALSSLSHHIDLDWMREAYRRTRKDGAAGIDGQRAEDFARDLDRNLEELLTQAKSGQYRAPAVRRVHIPKDGGKTRPLGIPTFSDKVLQRAVVMLLEPVYEHDFLDCSHGFRPGRSAHKALDATWKGLMNMDGGWVLDLDIRSFFDEVDRGHLQQMLRQRVNDGVVRRLVGKWLNAGVIEEGRVHHPTSGTPQGGVISPLLANIYLHVVLDVWFEREVKPRLKGRSFMVRYADDAVMCFARKDDALRVLDVLPKRVGRYGLRLHSEKTQLVRFTCPRRDKGDSNDDGLKPGTFDLLGLTHYWGRSRRGNWVVKRCTSKKRFSRALKMIALWCRMARHLPVKEQHKMLWMKLRGHYAYYGITGNGEALVRFRYFVKRIWHKWLGRRNQRRMSWDRFSRLEKRYPLPPAQVVHSVYRRTANP